VSEGNQLIACYPFSDPDIADTFTGQLCSGTINGQANLSIQGNELCLEYIPNSNFVGKENICIQVCDQAGACDSITVPINIYASTNTPPSIQAIPSSEIHADSTLLLCTTFDDPDIGDNHIIELCDEPNNGEASIEFSGNEICVRYIPNASFEGTENICLSVCDQENACDEIRIPITITQPTLSCETLFADISVQESISGCSGTDIELFVSNGSADFQYEWFTSNNNSVGTGSTVLLENVSVVDAGSYYVQISYENCISEINDPRFLTDLQVIPPSKGIAQTVGYLETCGTSIELEAIQSDGEEGYWASLNENTIAQIEAPNQPLTKVQNLQEGSNLFTWTLVTDECTPTTVDTLEIYVYETPIASDDAFSVAFNTPIGLDLIQNDLYSEDSLNIYIVSDLEHGQAMRNGKGLYTYTPEQNYVGTKSFIYKICNPICPDLCTEATVTLTIGANADCITGGLVTPNDDGFNDTFIVPCLVNHEGSALTIFNRYGDEVYHSLNYNNTWDGTYKGNPLPAGTYYYILAINDEVGTVINDYLFLQR